MPHVSARGRALPALVLAQSLLATLGVSSAHAATTKYFPAVADSRVEQANPSSNFGTYKLGGESSPVVRSYLKFDVTGLSGPVTAAQVRVIPNTASSSGFEVRGAASSSWSETGLTWNNAPAVGSAVSASGAYTTTSSYVSANATKLVTGNGTVTVVLTGKGSTWDQYRSREWGASSAPLLVVTTGSTTTADTTAPSVPSGLTASAGDGQVGLSWSASTDNVGVTGYRVYRNGSLVATTTTTSYTDTGLTNGTSYSYTVSAIDAAGNASAQSAPVSATPAGLVAGSSSGYYVSTSGSDANPGTQSAPWRTIGKAASAAPAGSSVTILGGSYGEDVTFGASGTSGAPTVFQAAPGATVSVKSLTFKASHLTVRGLTVSGASGACATINPALTDLTLDGNTMSSCGTDGVKFVRSTTATYTNAVAITNNTISGVGRSSTYGNDLTIYGDNVTVADNDLSGTPNDAIDMWGDGLTFRHNHIHDISNANGNHDDAFQTWTGLNDGAEGHPVTNLLIERNTVENVTGSNSHCLMSEGPGHSGWTIRSNVFRNIGDQCMILGKNGNGTQGIQNVEISNNTFVSAGANNTMEFNLTSSGVLASNIFYNCKGYNGSPPYYVASTASVSRDYNMSGGTSPKLTEPHGLNADPQFVSAGSNDYHLASGSPAVDSGDNGALVPVRTADLDGNATARAVDRGAYERP